MTIGNHTYQRTAECQNCWWRFGSRNTCGNLRVRLEVRVDNVAGQWSGPMNETARELALDLGDVAFKPDIPTHTPKEAPSVAQSLSRKIWLESDFAIAQTTDTACWRFILLEELRCGGDPPCRLSRAGFSETVIRQSCVRSPADLQHRTT